MLSFFIVYMSHWIKPSSVKSCLSGICAELEPIWPDVQAIQTSPLVTKSLAGCHKLFGSHATRKWALTKLDLKAIWSLVGHFPSHDDLLFLAITFMAWHRLMRLGELVNPDKCQGASETGDVLRPSTHRALTYLQNGHSRG